MKSRAFAAVLPLTLLCACATAPAVKAVDPITVEATSAAVREQSLTDFTAMTKVEVNNPGGPVKVTRAVWELFLDGASVEKGETALNVELGAEEAEDYEISAAHAYAKDEEGIRALESRGKAMPFALKGTVFVQGPSGERSYEFGKAAELRMPRLPKVEMQDLQAAKYSDEQIALVFYLAVNNPNSFDLALKQIDYQVEINGKPIGEGTTAINDHVPSGHQATYEVQLDLTADKFGNELSTLVRRNQLSYTLKGNMELGLAKIPIVLSGPIRFSK